MGPLFSNVSPQIKAMLQEQSPKTLTLREGQVILGKIKEILPNNTAVIQFGKHQMTASLEVPITADQSYLFEVISTGELPQLRVLTQSNSSFSLTEQIEQILTNLNINPSKEQLQFISELLDNQIPIKQTDLKQALTLYKKDQTQETKEQLMGLFKKQLPITETTLNAIKAIHSDQGLTNQLEALYQILESETADSETTQQLLAKLTVILSKGASQGANTSINQDQVEQLNRLLNHELTDQPLESGLNSSENEIGEGKQTNLNSKSIANQLTKQMGLSDRQIYQLNKILTLVEEQGPAITTKTANQLHSLVTNQSVAHKIVQQLPTQAARPFEAFIQQPNPELLTEFAQPLKELVEFQLPTTNQNQIFHLLGEINQTEPDLFPVKDQFLIHFKNYLLNAGLDFEHQIYEDSQKLTEQQDSLKQLLMQAITEQVPYTKEAEQIVDLLTGQQLTLLNENANFLHLSTIIPNIFGMGGDIEVEFYSRKNENEKIDADYCRIAFYLELEQLKTTVIDMNVQNRMIHLIVYNNHDISDQIEQFKPILKEGLEKFNYTLSTLSHKPMPDQKNQFGLKRDSTQLSFQMSQLDVRI